MNKIKITYKEMAEAIGEHNWYKDNDYLDACPHNDIYNESYLKESDLKGSYLEESNGLRGLFRVIPKQCSYVINYLERYSMASKLTKIRVDVLKDLLAEVCLELSRNGIKIKQNPEDAYWDITLKNKDVTREDILELSREWDVLAKNDYRIRGERFYPEVDQDDFDDSILEIDQGEMEEEIVERVISRNKNEPDLFNLSIEIFSKITGEDVNGFEKRLTKLIHEQIKEDLSNIKGLTIKTED